MCVCVCGGGSLVKHETRCFHLTGVKRCTPTGLCHCSKQASKQACSSTRLACVCKATRTTLPCGSPSHGSAHSSSESRQPPNPLHRGPSAQSRRSHQRVQDTSRLRGTRRQSTRGAPPSTTCVCVRVVGTGGGGYVCVCVCVCGRGRRQWVV
jgi:hypothetical protein